MKKKINAYLTVEASFLISIIIGVILLVVYLLFFQYDRCLLEHTTGVLGVRGCTLQITDKESLLVELMEYSEQKDKRYLAWSMDDVIVQLKGNSVFVKRDGKLRFPFRSLMFWDGDRDWQSSITFRNYRIEPVEFIRNYRKVLGGE